MKKLYLSDVDGTLTRGTPFPTEYTISTMKKLIAQGLNFTVATGRSLASIIDFYVQMEAKLPVVVLNGSLVYDINGGKAVEAFGIDKKVLPLVFDTFAKENIQCRMFVFHEKKQQVLNFRPIATKFPCSQKVNPNTGVPYEETIIVQDVPAMADLGEVLYIGKSGPKEVLWRIYQQVCKIDGVLCTFQSDPYDENNFYIDIFSDKAGKSSGVQVVADYMNATEVITFGDNANDICMLEHAHRSYAVADASDAVKSAAKFVLEDDGQDCVANFIKKDWKQQQKVSSTCAAR